MTFGIQDWALLNITDTNNYINQNFQVADLKQNVSVDETAKEKGSESDQF